MRNARFDFLYLPEIFHKPHKLCEFLVSQIEDFLIKEDFAGLRMQTIRLDEEPILLEGEHVLDYLKRVGENDKHDEVITSNILNAVIVDTCYFLQSALFASLQRRLVVTFALLRKPFVYNLIVILRLYFTSDFLERFNNEENFDTTGLRKEDIQELLTLSEEALLTKAIKATDIYNFVFNASDPDSLVNLSNKALHPSTTRNKSSSTEIQNLNFAFSTTENIETQWQYVYSRLPLLLMYLNEILEFVVFDHLKVDDALYEARLTERAEFFQRNVGDDGSRNQ